MTREQRKRERRRNIALIAVVIIIMVGTPFLVDLLAPTVCM